MTHSTTSAPAYIAADASGWVREYPTLRAARAAATNRARWTVLPCYAEGDSEPLLGAALPAEVLS